MQKSEAVPEFIMPTSIDKMTDEQLFDHLDGVRDRRLRMTSLTKRRKSDSQKPTSLDDVRAKLDKQYAMLTRDLEKLDKLTTSAEKRWNAIQAMRIQLGIDVMDTINDLAGDKKDAKE